MVREREQRQYALMRQRVDDLRTGRRDIGRVIDDLSALVWELQETPEDWRQRFIEAWSGLEVPYAMALAVDEPLPKPDEAVIVLALEDLDLLLDERQQSE